MSARQPAVDERPAELVPAHRPGGSAGPSRPRPSGGRGVARRRPFRRLTWIGQAQARKHAARPGRDGFVAPQLHEVRLPPGYRPVTDPAEMLALVDELPAVTAVLRSDSLRTRRAIWQALHGLLLHGGDMGNDMIIAGHGTIAEKASRYAGKTIGRSTVGNHMRAMEAAGVLHVAMRGASKEALGSDRHRAPVYVVLAPAGYVSTVAAAPLSPADQAAVDDLAARLDQAILAGRAAAVDEHGHLPDTVPDDLADREDHPRTTPYFSSSDPLSRSEPKSKEEPATPARRADPGRYAPRSAADRRVAVAWLAAVMGWPWKSSTEEELVKITGPWFSAGWSPRGVIRALQVQPDGTPWPGPLPEPHQRDRRDRIRIRNLWAVLTFRLRAWTDPVGQPLDPPVPTEQPPRGRPRKSTPAPLPAPVVRRTRPAHVEAELAAQAARRAAGAAARAAVDTERQARLARYEPQAAGEIQPQPPAAAPSSANQAQLNHARAVFRARIERGRRP